MAISSARHYLALDAARGLAALAVMIYHVEHLFDLKVFRGSFLAVDLFFLMSGLVVARAYEAKLQSGALSLWDFARVRALRLLPLYYAAIALGLSYFLAKLVLGQDDATELWVLLAILPQAILILPVIGGAAGNLGMFPYAPSAWSLSLEFWFNIFYAVLLPTLSNRVLWVIVSVALAIFAYESVRLGTTDLGWGLKNLVGGIARFCFSFALGVLIYRRGLTLTLPTWAFIALSVVTFAFMFLPSKAVLIHFIWILVFFPAFVVTALPVVLSGVGAWVSDHLGRLSYGIYILHIPVLLLAQGVYKAVFGIEAGSGGWAVGLFAVGAILLVTCLLTYGFDEPVRQALKPARRRHGVTET